MNFKCSICNCHWSLKKNDYACCIQCGHEVLINSGRQTYIINETLTSDIITRNSFLDRYKNSFVSIKRDSKDLNLLDIGSASGKFIHDNKDKYKNTLGLEVTPECIEFSRKVLNVKVIEDISQLELNIDIATAFHTFEHIPIVTLRNILGGLASIEGNSLEIIVSVPNASSLQYWLLGKNFAYYDVPNHIHQFSSSSLDKLMQSYGFSKRKTYRSWIYNLFGWLQGLANIGSKTKNYLYYRLKRGSGHGGKFQDFLSIIKVLFCAPVAIVLWFLEMLFINEKGVITICYKK